MKQKKQRFLVCALGLVALALGGTSIVRAQAPQGQAALPDLAGSLRKIEGCVGVETAQTSSGKQVIFAWFEDKKAATRWYWSAMHQDVMASFSPGTEPSDPMQDVPDNVGPILAIASLTLSTEREVDQVTLPISQIAIELYTPLSGGLALGGRFAPEGLKVPKRRIIVEDE